MLGAYGYIPSSIFSLPAVTVKSTEHFSINKNEYFLAENGLPVLQSIVVAL